MHDLTLHVGLFAASGERSVKLQTFGQQPRRSNGKYAWIAPSRGLAYTKSVIYLPFLYDENGQWAKAHFFFGRSFYTLTGAGRTLKMSTVNQQITTLAGRVAASHGLEVVALELQGGGGTHRTLRIFLERNAEGRAELERRLDAMRDEGAEEPQQDGAIVLDLVDAGETAGLSEEEDELAYLRELPAGVPVAQLSGVTHGDCERFSRDFGTALDVEDLLPGAEYLLEVSSPGLDRKLTKPEEFTRFQGQLCKVQLHEAIAGNRHWQGHLGRLEGDILTLHPLSAKKVKGKKKAVGDQAGEPVVIALGNIEKAQLVPEF